MELSEIIPHIEALIFASEKPLTSLEITELINNAFGFLEERVSLDQIESCIEGIREKYASGFYAFEVRESGGGWQFLTKKDFHKTITQLNGDKFLKRLSNAALETLAIIAYKQPITKGEIESIRGVNSDYSVQKLLEKELIIISGRNEQLPGHPLIYTTSKNFMDYFGINSTEDLPKIREVLADQMIEGTVINAEDFTSNTAITPQQETIETSIISAGEEMPAVPAGAEEPATPVPAQEEKEGEVIIQSEGPAEQEDRDIQDSDVTETVPSFPGISEEEDTTESEGPAEQEEADITDTDNSETESAFQVSKEEDEEEDTSERQENNNKTPDVAPIAPVDEQKSESDTGHENSDTLPS